MTGSSPRGCGVQAGLEIPLALIIGEGVGGGMDVTPAQEVGAPVLEGGRDLERSESLMERKMVGKGVIWREVVINSRT
jgi:hypothetical protein